MVKKRKAKGSTTDPSRRGVQKKRLAADQIEVSQRDVLEAPPQLAAIDNTTSDFPMFPIVGVGASAGGLEAFSELLAALPKEINFAVVLVQHMAPERKSELPELLRAKTKIPVVQLAAEMAIEPGRIYVIPPNVQLEIMQERFHVSPRPVDHAHLMPIDVFFHSLALRAGDRAVGVVLSGTASDGAMGLRDIKAYGGITIARQPDTARFDGMPTAAIAAEGVDLVLPPAGSAADLVQIAKNRFFPARFAGANVEVRIEDHHLSRIFGMLRGATGVDFALYKTPTVRRRLLRRMALQRVGNIEEYIGLLQQNAAEVQDLYRDILIHVTRFFREPDSFDALKSIVYPAILDGRRQDNPARIWIPGCSTGEEAYSVGISVLEYLGEKANATSVQIFATDVSETAVERARMSIYPEDITVDVSAERLQQFFTRNDGNYQVSKVVRGLCVFARQDLTRDPPFSRLDLIVCRNVLIYLTPRMQHKLMTLFHHALNAGGFLVLGSAETVGPHSELFNVADKKHRVYTKKAVDAMAERRFQLPYSPRLFVAPRTARDESDPGTVQQQANRLILDQYSPPGVIVGPNLQILHFRVRPENSWSRRRGTRALAS